MADRTSTVRVVVDADTSGASSKLAAFGKVGALAGAALAIGTVKGAAAATQAASEVQQSFAALDTVFKENAEQVQKWAAAGAQAVGLSKSQYAGLASIVGAQLKNVGFSLGESARQTNSLIGLSSDLAATFGGDVSEAVNAVSALLRGEYDTIERYGVSIKQSDINARLAAEGLDGLTGAAQKQAQAQAVLSILTQQTADAQGAFAERAGTLAGQQARLSAEWENAKAVLGEKLVPILATAIRYFREQLAPALARIANQVREALGPAFARFADFVRTSVLPVLSRLGGFIVERVVPALQSLAQWISEKVVPAIRSYLTPVLEGARSLFDQVAQAVKKNEPQLTDLLTAFRKVAEFVLDHVAPVLGNFVKFSLTALGTAIGIAISAVGGLVSIFQSVYDKIQAVIGAVSSLASKLSSIGSLGGLLGGDIPVLGRLAGDGARALGGININAQVSGFVGDESKLAGELRRIIGDDFRRFAEGR